MESCSPEETPDLDDQLRSMSGVVEIACFDRSYGLHSDCAPASLPAAKLSGSDGKVCWEAETLLAFETDYQILRSMERQRTSRDLKTGIESARCPCLVPRRGEKYLRIILLVDRERRT
jgi:hypothetical protein